MSLKSQILAIILAPLLALTVVGGLKTQSDWTRSQNAHKAQIISSDATSLLGVVHALQVERGLSAGFLSSSRNVTTLTDTLKEAHTATDAAIAAVPDTAKAPLLCNGAAYSSPPRCLQQVSESLVKWARDIPA